MERILQRWYDMISICSVNGHEAQMADYVANVLRELGMEAHYSYFEEDTARERPSVWSVLDSGRPGKTVLLIGHLDTVDVSDRWKTDPFTPTEIDGKVYTAATVGTVLPGVTRRSCIELLKDWGYEVIEGKLAIADIMQAARDGKLEEVFGTGTAAVVSPVKELVWKGEHAYIGDGKIGAVTQKLYDTMTGMQWGKIPDTKGWIVPVEKKY